MITEIAPLSSLSKMMLDSVEVALAEAEYVSALEYIIVVAAVDKHPDVTIALASTVLEIISAIDPTSEAPIIRARLVDTFPKMRSTHYEADIRRYLDPDTLVHVVEIARKHPRESRDQFHDSTIFTLVKNLEALVREFEPLPTIKFISKSNTQIKFHNAKLYGDIATKLVKLITCLGGNILEHEVSDDQKKATRKDTFFDLNSILVNTQQSVTIRTYIADDSRSPRLVVKQSEKVNSFEKYQYLNRLQYRAPLTHNQSNEFLNSGISVTDLRKMFATIIINIDDSCVFRPVGDAFIRRSVIRFKFDEETYFLYIDKFYFYDRSADDYSETFVELEIVCSEAGQPNPVLYRFMDLIESVLDLEVQPKSKYQRFVEFKTAENLEDYYYFVGIDLLTRYKDSVELHKQLVQRFHKVIKDSVTAIVDDEDILMITPVGDAAIVGLKCDWSQIEQVVKYLRAVIHENNKEDAKRRIEYKIAVHFGTIFQFTDVNNEIGITGEGIDFVSDILQKSTTGKFFISEQAFKKISETRKIKFKSQKSFKFKPNGHAINVYEYRLD
jgi:hypothetical protein